MAHHRVQALGGAAVRPLHQAPAPAPPLASAPARRSPQKAGTSTNVLSGPSRMVDTTENDEPAQTRTRVRSGRYPETLAVSASTTALAGHVVSAAIRPNVFAEQPTQPALVPPAPASMYGRSISHQVLPTGSMMSPEQSGSTTHMANGHGGMGHAYRPVLAPSFSTTSLPAIPPTSESSVEQHHQHEPIRRFAAPAARIIRPTSTEDGPHQLHAPTTPGYALRGAVRPQAVARPDIAPIGGKLGLGQAQRRVISAPLPAQLPPPEVEYTPVPPLAMRSADVVQKVDEQEATRPADEEGEVLGEAGTKEGASAEPIRPGDVMPMANEVEPSTEAEVAATPGQTERQIDPEASENAQAVEEAGPEVTIPSTADEEPDRPTAHESPTKPTPTDGGSATAAVPAAIPLPESPAKAPLASSGLTAPTQQPAPIAAPHKPTRKAGLPAAARRPAPTGTAASSSTEQTKAEMPKLPTVRSYKPRVPAPERKPFKPVSHSQTGASGSTGGMSRSASASTVLSAGTGPGLAAKATGSASIANTVNTGRTAGLAKAGPAEGVARVPRKVSKPPLPTVARAPVTTARAAPPAAAPRPARPAVPKAVLPAGYTRPTTSTSTKPTVPSRGPSSLTAPTAASARRAAERVVSGSSTSAGTSKATTPAITAKPTLPPVRRERVRMKAPMPAFQPVRGRNNPASGPAVTATATSGAASSARAASRAGQSVSVSSRAASAAGADAGGGGVIAKVKTMPPPSVPVSAMKGSETPAAKDVPLPGSPGMKPVEVPLPESPVVEYRGMVKVKKHSMALIQFDDEELEQEQEGVGKVVVRERLDEVLEQRSAERD